MGSFSDKCRFITKITTHQGKNNLSNFCRDRFQYPKYNWHFGCHESGFCPTQWPSFFFFLSIKSIRIASGIPCQKLKMSKIRWFLNCIILLLVMALTIFHKKLILIKGAWITIYPAFGNLMQSVLSQFLSFYPFLQLICLHL